MRKYSFPNPKVMDNYEVISFDLFDTLISRSVNQPHQIFLDNGKLFWFLRRGAEFLARKMRILSKQEISISDIYKLLPFWDPKDEYILEMKHTVIVPEGYVAFKSAQILKKQIYIVSDMYLPSTFLETLLIHHNFPKPYTLIVSNEYGKSKTQGLFNDIYPVGKRASILHLGDNYYSDYCAPTHLGITAIHILVSN
jgi:predicted HAD superfamily hydrolase